MQAPNDDQNFGSNDPIWILLAELSLGDFLSDHNRRDSPTAGLLFQVVQELGIPLQCVENIAMLVAGFAKESPVHYQQDELELLGHIRIFCQKKIIDNLYVARIPSRAYPTEQAREHSPMFLDFGTKMNGGWGCFLIKRGGNVSDDVSLSSHQFVDLYLYREG